MVFNKSLPQRSLSWIFQRLDIIETSNAADKKCIAVLRHSAMMHVLRRLSSGTYPIKDTATVAIATFSASIQHLSFKQTVAVITQVLDMFDHWEKIEGAACVSLLKLLPNAVAAADNAEQAHGLEYEGVSKLQAVLNACIAASEFGSHKPRVLQDRMTFVAPQIFKKPLSHVFFRRHGQRGALQSWLS